ncbi:MAG: hypothetical protein WAM62_01490, partial [Pseudolabrys sp.]
DHGIEPLAAALLEAMAQPPEVLRTMGQRGQTWMVRDFSWNRVADDMVDIYKWLAFDADMPPTVRTR